MIRTIAIIFAVFFALLMSGFIHRPADCALIFGARSTICTTDWSFWIMIAGGVVCIYFWDKSRPRHSEPRDEQAQARVEGRAEGGQRREPSKPRRGRPKSWPTTRLLMR
jgi:hypothetical protein